MLESLQVDRSRHHARGSCHTKLIMDHLSLPPPPPPAGVRSIGVRATHATNAGDLTSWAGLLFPKQQGVSDYVEAFASCFVLPRSMSAPL